MALPPIEAWIAAALTLMVYSYILVRENPLSRLAEALFVGVSIGNLTVMAVRSLLTSGVNPMLGGKPTLLIPMALGVLLFTMYSRSYGRLSGWPVAVMNEIGVGLAIRGSVHSYIYDQVKASMVSLAIPGDPISSLNGVVMLVGLITTLSYFLFTMDVGAAGERVRSLGRYSMMLFFGAMFGQVAMTRISYISGRVQFLVGFFTALLGR
jgi:hypothetical protein